MPGDMSWMEERYRELSDQSLLWEPPTLESPNQPRCEMDGKPTIMLSANNYLNLTTHPKVMDAAVFGVPNEEFGEEVKGVIQIVPGHIPGDTLEAELIAFCRQHLAAMKCPRTIDFIDELPRLPTGKLYKRVLRDRYWGDRQSRIL